MNKKKVEQHSVFGTAITSKFLDLTRRDFVRGLVIAVVSPIFTIVGQSVEKAIKDSAATGFIQFHLVIDWTSIWHVAVAAGGSYLLKNFFEPTQTVVVVKPPLADTPTEQSVKVTPTTEPKGDGKA